MKISALMITGVIGVIGVINVIYVVMISGVIESKKQNIVTKSMTNCTGGASEPGEWKLELIQSSTLRAKGLFESAKNASQTTNGVIYGGISKPLIAFLTPKAGANTLSYYLRRALALAVMPPANSGCGGGDRYSCMFESPETSCHIAFINHFQPHRLVDVIVSNERAPGSRCHRWSGSPLPYRNVYKEVLSRSLCFTVIREPVDRAIASYYEWHYKKTSNLTAIQYLEKYGPEGYLKLINHQIDFLGPMWPSVLENCFVGVTDKYSQFVSTMSRALKLPFSQSEKMVQMRKGEKVGFNADSYAKFHNELSPFLSPDKDLWSLAGKISHAQHKIAEQFLPLSVEDDNPNCLICASCPSGTLNWKWADLLVNTNSGDPIMLLTTCGTVDETTNVWSNGTDSVESLNMKGFCCKIDSSK